MLTSINRKHYLWALIVVAPLVMLLTSVSVVRARLPISHLTVIDAIEIGGGSTYMALTPNGRRLYAVQLRGATPDVYGEISVIDTFDNEIIGSIELNTDSLVTRPV